MLSVHLFKIKRPERGNQLGNLWKKKRPYDAPGSTRPENSQRFAHTAIRGARLVKGPALANCGSTNNTGR
jgi:hypothetical protein